MDYLPIFADLRDKPVLIVGGGDVAARKIELLRRAGARAQIVARELCAELTALHASGAVEWLAEEYQSSQLDHVWMVIAATDNGELNSRVYTDAGERRLLANVWMTSPNAPLSFLPLSIVHRWWWRSLPAAPRRFWRVCCVKSWKRCCLAIWDRWRKLPDSGGIRLNSASVRCPSAVVLGNGL